jgi:signal transduction histidine kinase
VSNRTRLKQLLIAAFVLWPLAGVIIGFFGYNQVATVPFVLMMTALVAAALVSVLTLNQSQNEVSEVNKNHSRTKRQLQELQLKIDRFEYDSKKAGELRRIVLNSTQEKDHSLRNMALSLDHAMDEILELTDKADDTPDFVEQIRTRAEGMKRYSADLQSLARLELKSELPTNHEVNFLVEMDRLIEEWSTIGKSKKVKVKLENREDEIPLFSDMLWVENILTRVALALVRMNEQTTLNIHLIGYLDAEMGDALRIEFTIAGRELDEQQLKHLLTEYVSILEDGQEIGPGLAFVVARRMAQILNGSIDVDCNDDTLEVVVIIPRNPAIMDDSDDNVII